MESFRSSATREAVLPNLPALVVMYDNAGKPSAASGLRHFGELFALALRDVSNPTTADIKHPLCSPEGPALG
jgi:hypothetical protein